jgi:Abortive infection alpha
MEARGKKPEHASLSIALPILIAAADESREELQDIWARLLAAAADPERAKSFRNLFIETVQKLDPCDAIVLRTIAAEGGASTSISRERIVSSAAVSDDQVLISIANLSRLGLLPADGMSIYLSAFGREFLRAISD